MRDSSNLNIVPVDFSAKAIVRAVDHDEIKELNIVSRKGISLTVNALPTDFLVFSIFNTAGCCPC
jgi:hypothetical protein